MRRHAGDGGNPSLFINFFCPSPKYRNTPHNIDHGPLPEQLTVSLQKWQSSRSPRLAKRHFPPCEPKQPVHAALCQDQSDAQFKKKQKTIKNTNHFMDTFCSVNKRKACAAAPYTAADAENEH